MYLEVIHITEYRYPQPAWDSFNELRLFPVEDHRQSLLDFKLLLEPDAPVRSHIDYYGSRVHQFHLAKPHQRLYIETRSRVVTYPIPAPLAVTTAVLPALHPRFFAYLAPTGRVPLHQEWLDQLGIKPPDPEENLVEYLSNLTRFLHGYFTYQPHITRIDTPLAEFMRLKTGVCQDYAHAMLALCRCMGIPSRYVSGYLYTGNSDAVGAEASHAWVEVFLPGSGWVGFDPTNGSEVTEGYVKVGHGRDYDDVPPVRGLRRGGGRETLQVRVHVTRYTPEEEES
ncbi:MAG: transglutaminase family protein [Nitrospinota bacterium]|nr:MAG: transglutaminase family protein [Nitrospinota bacterium]